MLDNARKFGSSLKNISIKKGSRVLFLVKNRIETPEIMLGILSIGAVVISINGNTNISAINEIIGELKPECIILFDFPDINLLLNVCKNIVVVNCSENGDSSEFLKYEKMIGEGCSDVQVADVHSSHPAFIFMTSGSSGKPKAVVASHGKIDNILSYFFNFYSQLSSEENNESLENSDNFITTLPISHMSSMASFFVRILNGIPVYLLDAFDQSLYLQLLLDLRCRYIMLVPSMYMRLLDEIGKFPGLNCNFVKYTVVVGEVSRISLIDSIERLFNSVTLTPYGLTECVSGIGYLKSDFAQGLIKRESCGKLFFGEAKLVDECGKTVASEGELWVKNATVDECYLDGSINDEKICNGWFRTGDIFYRDEEGYYFYKGRADDMFICNGYNIFPLSVENLLAKHPCIEMACVVPIIDLAGNQIPAVMASVSSESFSEQELIVHCVKNGPTHAIPKYVLFVNDIPKLATGKMDKKMICEALQKSYNQSRIYTT